MKSSSLKQTKLRARATRWGHSLSIRIPKIITTNLQIHDGDELELIVEKEDVERGSFLVQKTTSKITLEDLVGGITEENMHDVCDWPAPIGRELI